MQLQNSFLVSSPVDKAWDFFLDVENIVPCMPGAELVETVDDKNWRGRLKIKFGPVAMAFEGTVEMVERDDAERRMMLRGAGKDQRGRGNASADIHVVVEPGPQPDTTSVSVFTDLKVSGQIAQFGRGMMQDVSEQMTKKFAHSLQARLQQSEPVLVAEPGQEPSGERGASAPVEGAPAPAQAPARPAPREAEAVAGFRLLMGLLVRALLRQFGKLRGSEGARRGN
ncbi:SRPBCC family protein [Streptomyces cellulosae]